MPDDNGLRSLDRPPAFGPTDFDRYRDYFNESLSTPKPTEDTDMKGFSLQIIVSLVRQVADQISPQLRQMLKEFILELEKKARKTDNPWDDFAVDVAKVLLGIDEKPA